MNEKILELRISVYLKNDLKLNNMYEEVSKLVNYSMEGSDYLSDIHKKQKTFKHYCISGLYPTERDRIYKCDNVYNFMIRSYNTKLIKNLQKCLMNIENNMFVVMSIDLFIYNKSNIEYVDTLTPAIIIKDNLCWNIYSDDIDYFKKYIFMNLANKYNSLQGLKMNFNYDDIIKDIEIKNSHAITFDYKGIKMLSYKLRIYFHENNIDQEVANLSIAEGVGQKNSSMATGFCKPYFLNKR